MNESKTKVESYINKYQITYTTLLDTEATVARNYGIRGVPTKVLVGPDGKLFCYPCYDLANQVEELLKKPAAPPKSVEKEIKEKGRATIDVKFKTNKADIVPDYDSELVKFADVLKKYPDLNVTIEGYTDNKGTAKYNKTLSQKRAESVKKYFVDKLGIDASRLKAVGYGPEKPIADNKTEEGRKKNRRVEASVDYRTEKNVK
jgi:outer membrane protein OmpA-like peptidoglycan-associated protein